METIKGSKVINVSARPKQGLEIDFFYCNQSSKTVDIIFNNKDKLYKIDYIDTIHNKCKSIIGIPTTYNILNTRVFNKNCFVKDDMIQKCTITVDCSDKYGSKLETIYISTIRNIELITEENPDWVDPSGIQMIINGEVFNNIRPIRIDSAGEDIQIAFSDNDQEIPSIIKEIQIIPSNQLTVSIDRLNVLPKIDKTHALTITDKNYQGGEYVLKILADVFDEHNNAYTICEYLTVYTEPEEGVDSGMSYDPNALSLWMDVNGNVNTDETIYEVQTDTEYAYVLRFYNNENRLNILNCVAIGSTVNKYNIDFNSGIMYLEIEPAEEGNSEVIIEATFEINNNNIIERRFTMNLAVSKKEEYFLFINGTPSTELLAVPVGEEVLLDLELKDKSGKSLSELSYDTIIDDSRLSLTCDEPHTSPYKLIAKENGEYEFYFTAYLRVTKHKQAFKIKTIAGTGIEGPKIVAHLNGDPIKQVTIVEKDKKIELSLTAFTEDDQPVYIAESTMNANVTLNPEEAKDNVWNITPSKLGLFPTTFVITLEDGTEKKFTTIIKVSEPIVNDPMD